MSNRNHLTISLAVTAVLASTAAWAAPPRPVDPAADMQVPAQKPEKPAHQAKMTHATPVIPSEEPVLEQSATASTGLGTTGVFSASQSSSASPLTAIAPPVTITYAGANTALTITDSGTGKGLSSSLSNATSASSAVLGTAVGKGPGVRGVNSGTGGPGGIFSVTNAGSEQPGAYVTTAGTGPAVLAVTTTASSDYPTIYGTNTTTSGYGLGVEGIGNYLGVYGGGAITASRA